MIDPKAVVNLTTELVAELGGVHLPQLERARRGYKQDMKSE